MRLGPLEIIVIIVIIIAIAVIARIFRASRGTAKQNKEPPVDTPVKPVEGRTGRTRNFLKRVGVACIFTGSVLLLAGISMFRWAFQSYSWAFIIVVIGLVLLFLSRKK